MNDRPREIWCDTGLYWDYVEDWSEGSWRNHDDWGGEKYVRADYVAELEAKLAKAVEALQWLKAEIEDHGFSGEGPMLSKCSTTLAELTKERSDEKGETE